MELAAIIVAFSAPLAAAVATWFLNRKIQQVHVLVNSRLETALNEIATLKVSLQSAVSELAQNKEDSEDG